MWASGLADRAFTMLSYECKKKYPKANFTTVGRSTTPSSFPNVYFKKLQGSAIGYTLENAQINAVILAVQIEVVDNASQQTAEDISWYITEIMASLGFQMVGDPFPDDSEDVYRYVTRYQRIIGASEKLNF